MWGARAASVSQLLHFHFLLFDAPILIQEEAEDAERWVVLWIPMQLLPALRSAQHHLPRRFRPRVRQWLLSWEQQQQQQQQEEEEEEEEGYQGWRPRHPSTSLD